jgi:hypothetical protein
MFAGWFSVSFGSVDASLTVWDRLLEVPTFELKFPPCPSSSSGMEGSPSTINSESSSDFGRASGASDSNKILSEGTYKRKLDFLKFSVFGKSNFKAVGTDQPYFFFLLIGKIEMRFTHCP